MADGGASTVRRAGTTWTPRFSAPAWQRDTPAEKQRVTPLRRRDDCSRAITDKSRRFIEANFADRVTLRELEAITGCSSFAIMRAFRRGYGMTFHAFLMATRISHATRLLANGETAAVTALLVGFVDQSHFIRHFKRLLGTTPKRFLAEKRRAQAPIAVGLEQMIAAARARAAIRTSAERLTPAMQFRPICRSVAAVVDRP
jgi:AraC-like DNA-binding protein